MLCYMLSIAGGIDEYARNRIAAVFKLYAFGMYVRFVTGYGIGKVAVVKPFFAVCRLNFAQRITYLYAAQRGVIAAGNGYIISVTSFPSTGTVLTVMPS